jgi:hypothetical protein
MDAKTKALHMAKNKSVLSSTKRKVGMEIQKKNGSEDADWKGMPVGHEIHRK